ncbi:MAG: chitobiase/beta-hexosaminidase C-terminal domain-containing protein [bacterium]|nr:MAG: chitobiase/beta-hexosaminidase C-terminal domain-containing protein [bacterium]
MARLTFRINVLLLFVLAAASATPGYGFAREAILKPAPGEYDKPITVVFDLPQNTRVYYTLDGSEPGIRSLLYGKPLTIEDDTIIRYYTVDSGGRRSSVQEAFYRIRLQMAPGGGLRTVADPPAGLYSERVRVTLSTREGATIYYTIDGSDPSTESDIYRAPLNLSVDTRLKFFAMDADGSREPVRTEAYRFKLASRMVDTTPPAARVTPLPSDFRAGDLIRLTANEESRIYYTLDGSDPTEESSLYEGPFWLSGSSDLKFFAVDASGNRSMIYSEVYLLDQDAPSSEAYPPTGLYTSPLKVTISVSDADARVHYTLNGIAPTTDSPVYGQALVLTKDTVLQFFSVDPNGNREAVREETYLFDDDAPVTVADPPGGDYVPPIQVSLRTETGARTHYSLDGSDPDVESPIYFRSLTFLRPTTLKFFSMDLAGNMERIQTHRYGLVSGVWRRFSRGVYLIPSVTNGRTFWMGSESGLAVYNVGSGERTFLGAQEGLLGSVINDLVLDEEGHLWVATELGLNYLRPGAGFIHYTPDEGMPGREVLGLGVDRDGSIWAGTRNGVARIRDGVVKEVLTVADGLPHNTVLSVAVDYSGNKWFGSMKGLARLSGGKWSIFDRDSGMVDDEIRTVAVDRDWNVWVGTPRGVSVFDREKWTNYTRDDGLPGPAVVLIAPDPDGEIWVATRTGVARFVEGRFVKENPP